MTKKTTLLALLGAFFISPNDSSAQVNDVQMYGFIHSLVDHALNKTPVPNNETATPYWVNEISKSANNSYSFTGQFGQIPTHVDHLPPQANMGYPSVASPWDPDTGETFGTSRINTILVTAANFIQWVPPTSPDPGDPSGRTIVNNTATLFDWTNNEKPNLRYYIYGNWPEMDNAKAFPPTLPTPNEIAQFHDITMGHTGSFNNWWLQYQDALLAIRPELNAKLIPVGRIISQIHTEIIPNQIPFDELYEDSAPHGRANTYFLAGLITYMAVYEQPIPEDFMPSSIIHPAIRNNLTTINDFIWKELNNFNFPNGQSRVFHTNLLSTHTSKLTQIKSSFSNPIEHSFVIKFDSNETHNLSIFNTRGTLVKNIPNVKNTDTINIEDLASGLYYVKINGSNSKSYFKKLIKK